MLHGPNLTNPPSQATVEQAIRGHSQIVAVDGLSARNALAATVTASITPADPLWVLRRDTGNIERFDGTAWATHPGPVTDWTEPTYQSGWAAYGGGFQTPQTRKVGDRVEMRGLVAHTNAAQVGTIFTLPVGQRPATTAISIAISHVGSARIDILPSGAVQLERYFPNGSAAFVVLDQVSFSTLP